MSTISELVVDAYGCRAELSDADAMLEAARRAAKKVGARVATEAAHRFQPHGITVCLILMESHLIISTWPEHRQAIVNVFLCNPSMDPRVCWDVLAEFLKPERCTFHRVEHRIGKSVKVA